jgi:enoyl-CoA hydratase/carnithine racemase
MYQKRFLITLFSFHMKHPFIFSYVCRQKVPPAVYRNLLVFGKRYTGPEAAASGLVDKAVAASQVEAEAVNLLESVLGKDGFRRDSMGNMKKDVYIEALKDVRGHRS